MTRPLPDGTLNDRFRDLVDVLMMRALVVDYAALRAACEEVFARRGTHPWPPVVAPPENWREPFARMAAENALPIRDIDAAVAAIQRFITDVSSSTPRPAHADLNPDAGSGAHPSR